MQFKKYKYYNYAKYLTLLSQGVIYRYDDKNKYLLNQESVCWSGEDIRVTVNNYTAKGTFCIIFHLSIK